MGALLFGAFFKAKESIMKKIILFICIITFNLACGNLTYVYGSYQFVTKWGSTGTGDGQFNYPLGIAVTVDGYVYVADNSNYRIQKFDSSGAFITKWYYGDTVEDWLIPLDVAVDGDGYVYVSDNLYSRIYKFDSFGNYVTKWGSQGTGDGQFSWAYGITADPFGYIYTAECGSNNRIQKFDSWGTFFTMWGTRGTEDGQFIAPDGVAADADGYVYVADSTNCRIQKFTSSGTFVSKWGSGGTGEGQFNYPDGVAVDADGFVYVADWLNNRIQKFTSSGTFITMWGSLGTGDGQFNNPRGIAVDADGFVYVADSKNNRIQKFEQVCPVSALMDNEQGNIDLIRNLRDKILISTRTGEEYIQMFYKHSTEITEIMKYNPAIKETTYELLHASFSYILSRLIGDSVTVPPAFIAEIEKLCDAVSIKASPSLKKDINRVKADLKNGGLLKAFGVEAAKP